MSAPFFDTLPVEILYRLFDNLDAQTILISLRYVSKRFYLTTNTYNRYNFNFKSIAKPYFHLICQIIPSENVISLTLSDEDKTRGQIQLFLALFHIEQFTRLQSLTLLEISETYLNIFSKYIISSSLKSVAISTQIVNNREKITSSLLSSAIGHHSIQNLDLSIWAKDWRNLQWPINCTLKYLRFVNTITIKQFRLILRQFSNLRTLTLKQIDASDNENYSHDISCSQLSSLIFEDGFIEVKILEKCISLTPSLTYLRLSGTGSLFNSSFDGFQWENLIQTKLNCLEKFEFFLHILTPSNYRSRNIEILVNSFRTSFWINRMNCAITCDYITNSHKIILYTLPICTTRFMYLVDFKKISSSNFTRQINQQDMDHVQKLQIQLTKDINFISKEKNESSNPVLFRNVTNLTIENNGEWPQASLQFLSTICDLARMTKLSLSVNFTPENMSNTVTNISLLFEKTLNLRSLLLFDYWAADNCMKRMKTICSIISPNIKHLKIRVKNIDDIKYILEHLEHLTSVTFEYAQILTINREDFIEFLATLTRISSLWDSQYALYVWLGNKKNIF